MKKHFKILSVIITAALVLTLLPATALAAEEGGYVYSVDGSGNATIIAYTGPDADIHIPGTLGGHTVTRIGDIAFYGKTGVTSISVPDSVTDIGNLSFYACDVQSILLGGGVALLGENAFLYCQRLNSIGVKEPNPNFNSAGGVLFNDSGTKLVTYPYAKTGSSYTVPDGVLEIGNKAFFAQQNLSDITLPSSLDTIDDSAFWGATMKSITIPEGVQTISASAFQACMQFTSVTIPGSVDAIGTNAFYACSSLVQAGFLGDAPSTFGDTVFDGAAAGFKIRYTAGASGWTSPTWNGYHCVVYDDYTYTVDGSGKATITGYEGPGEDLVIPGTLDGHTVAGIATGAFENETDLTSVSIPDSVIGIGSNAFAGCANLASFSVGASNPNYSSTDGVLFNKYGVSLVRYPYGKTDASYDVPDGVEDISAYSFSTTTHLKSITLPSSVNSIGYGAFMNSVLESITIPEGVQTIYPSAFQACAALTEVTIPDSADTIGDNAFYGCGLLAQAKFLGDVPSTFGTDVFNFTASGFKILCPTGKGWTVPNWNGYTSEYFGTATVTFDTRGAGHIDSQDVECGQTVMRPSDPSKTGFGFAGWYKDTACTQSWNFATDIVTGSMELHAKWTCVITVSSTDAAYGSVSGGGTFAEGAMVTLKATPASGYNFAGWYESGRLVWVNATYSFAAAGHRSLTAQFDVLGLPMSITATATAYNKVSISWSAVSGASGYQLYRSTSQGGTYSLVKTTAARSYTNSKLKTGTTYYYKVRAYKKVGGKKIYGSYSLVASAKPVLSNISGFKASAYSPTAVKVSWGKVSGRSGYEIWRSTSPDSGFKLVKSTSSASYKNTGLTPSVTGSPVTYHYKVRAYRTVSGVRVYSAFTAITSASPMFANVSGVSAARSSATKIKVSWGKVTGAGGYEVWRSTTPDGDYTLVKSTTSRSYTNSGLTTGVPYYYKVRAYVKVKGIRVYSALSGAVSTTP